MVLWDLKQVDDSAVFPPVKLWKNPEMPPLHEEIRSSSWCSDYGAFPLLLVDEDYNLKVSGANFSPAESKVRQPEGICSSDTSISFAWSVVWNRCDSEMLRITCSCVMSQLEVSMHR